MGTLGEYLRSAREAKEIDIRDAAQQTRISINYLKALEQEDFVKLPGEVFVKGFLKNYARFLNLDEAETLKRYAELKPKPPSAVAVPGEMEKTEQPEPGSATDRETPVEPFIWGAVICIALLFFIFAALPKHSKKDQEAGNQTPAAPQGLLQDRMTSPVAAEKTEKLYLEVIAVEDTWLLVRTDTSPQKKAVLKKGESLIWSADDRFLITYGRLGDVKLLLNGEELAVTGAPDIPVRDLAVARNGIVSQPVAPPQPRPVRVKPQPIVAAPVTQGVPDETKPSLPASGNQPSAQPSSVPVATPPAPVPAQQPDVVPAPVQ